MCLPHTPVLPCNPAPSTPAPHTPALPTPQAQLWLLFQVVLDGPASSVTLHNLTVGTEYLVSVLLVGEPGVGEGLGGLVSTGGWGGITLGFGVTPPAGGVQSLAWSQPARGVTGPSGPSVPSPELLAPAVGLLPSRAATCPLRSFLET